MGKVNEWREGLKRRALDTARETAEALVGFTVLLIGSYARGILVRIVVWISWWGDFTEPPHRRLLSVDLPGNVKAIALNMHEAIRRCYSPAQDVALGIVLRDDLGVADRLIEMARGCLKRTMGR